MDNSIYAENIRLFEKNWPEDAALLKDDEKSSDITCEIAECEDKLIPLVHRGDKVYQLSSVYPDNIIIDRWMQNVNFDQSDNAIIMFGLGTGMYVRSLLEKADEMPDRKISIFVYEPDQFILKELIKYFDFSDIFSDSRVTISIGFHNGFGLRNWIGSHINYNNVNDAGSAFYLNYPRIYPEEREKYDETIGNELMDFYAGINFHLKLGNRVFDNLFTNTEKFMDSYSLDSFVDMYPSDIPVFIVSSGPSLAKNIGELKKAKGKGLIVATDSSLGVFDKNGIIPDIYISIDPVKQKANFEMDWVRDVPALAELSSPAFVTREGQMSFFVCHYDDYVALFLNRDLNAFAHTSFTDGGSVANYAFILAELLKPKHIVLLGQDLAYTDNQAHSAGVAIDDDNMTGNLVETVDINGNPIMSSASLMSYKRWFERTIRSMKDVTVTDATEGGALIEGTEVLTLRETIDRYCVREVDMASLFSKCRKLFDSEKAKAFKAYMCEVPVRMDEIISDSDKLIRVYDDIETMIKLGKGSVKKIQKLLKKSGELSDKIEENWGYVYVNMLNSDSARNVTSNINHINEDMNEDILNVCDLGRDHTEKIKKSAEKIKETFNGLKFG